MHKTQFAGLTAPDEGDPALMVDGGTFATRNPDIIDHFLRIGAVSHVHDGHAPMPDPVVAGSAVVGTSGGTIPSGRDLYIGYTLLDKYGGETRISPVTSVSTPPGIPDPSTAITADYEAGAGDMVVGAYYFGITLVDHVGGETVMGPTAFVERPPGDPFGQVNLSGLAAELGPDGADHWRLWRADNGGAFHIIATGTTDTFTDDGINPTDLAAEPPATSQTTGASNMVTVTLPAADEPGLNPAGLGSGFALYVSDDGAFGSPSLYAVLPVASAVTPIVITALNLLTGSPPDVSTSIPGAAKITADEIVGGGGGGGGVGPLEMWPPFQVRQGTTMQGALLAKYALNWSTEDGVAVFGRFFEEADPTWIIGGRDTQVYDNAGANDYVPADWLGDTGDVSWNAGGWVDFDGATGADHAIYLPSAAAGRELLGYMDYSITTDDWDHFFVGAEAVAFGNGYVAVIDRTAGTLSIALITNVSPFGYVVVASIGAAQGYTPPVIGDTGSLVFRQVGNHVWASDSRWTDLIVHFNLGINEAITLHPAQGIFGGKWSAVGAFTSDYIAFSEVPTARELVAAPIIDAAVVETQAVRIYSSSEQLTDVTAFGGTWAVVAGRRAPAYRKFRGHLEIVGSVEGGTPGTSAFSVPTAVTESFAPVNDTTVVAATDTGTTTVTVGADGSVTPNDAGPVHLNISIPLG
jgi:hypothetical protein